MLWISLVSLFLFPNVAFALTGKSARSEKIRYFFDSEENIFRVKSDITKNEYIVNTKHVARDQAEALCKKSNAILVNLYNGSDARAVRKAIRSTSFAMFWIDRWEGEKLDYGVYSMTSDDMWEVSNDEHAGTSRMGVICQISKEPQNLQSETGISKKFDGPDHVSGKYFITKETKSFYEANDACQKHNGIIADPSDFKYHFSWLSGQQSILTDQILWLADANEKWAWNFVSTGNRMFKFIAARPSNLKFHVLCKVN